MTDYLFLLARRNSTLANELGEWRLYTATCRNRRATRRSRTFALAKSTCSSQQTSPRVVSIYPESSSSCTQTCPNLQILTRTAPDAPGVQDAPRPAFRCSSPDPSSRLKSRASSVTPKFRFVVWCSSANANASSSPVTWARAVPRVSLKVAKARRRDGTTVSSPTISLTSRMTFKTSRLRRRKGNRNRAANDSLV